jgi:4,5-DOPA dioxygenase extradiol
MSTVIPALFVSHGSPMFALEPGQTGPALRAWAQALPAKPQGIVILSPHWMTPGVQVMTHPHPPTWHDFGGFAPALYALQYPAPGAPLLADRVMALLDAAGIATQPNAAQPFDHGAWVPLMHVFPQADVPVVQVSLPARYSPESVFAMGQALASLREEQILIIGSGSMTHNLREFMAGRPALDAQPAPYVREFSDWVGSSVTAGQIDDLLRYRSLAPSAVQSHPTDEHFVPLYFALGAGALGAGGQATMISREVMYAHLAMDALQIQ